MSVRILVIGGYGNFGSYIARTLATDDRIELVIGGRSLEKAERFAAALMTHHPAQGVSLDIFGDFEACLAAIDPAVVIHTVGPFQAQSYAVAQACAAQGRHYLDLADARSFVCGIDQLDAQARANDSLVVSGASSVPCLTAAVIDEALHRFSELTTADYGISAAQQTNRGLGTASAIMSYIGKPFQRLSSGLMSDVWGWQGLHGRRYPELGWRLFGHCDIPDLDLFPARYPSLKSMRFAAGHEIKLLHFGTWLLSWLVRFGILKSLEPYADGLLKASFWFDFLGSSRSGFHMFLEGTGPDGKRREERFWLIARSGHGPFIPCMPAILLAKRLARGEEKARGARACLGLVTLDDYLAALHGLDISIYRDGHDD